MLKFAVSDFRSIVGNSLDEVARRNLNHKLLARVRLGGQPVVSLLTSADMERLADALEEQIFTQGQIVIREGEQGDTLYVIKQGKASIYTEHTRGATATIGEGVFFGETASFSPPTPLTPPLP